MESILVDSNVLIAFFDSTHINHAVVKKSIPRTQIQFAISTASVIECLIRAYDRGYEFAIEYEITFRELISERLDLTNPIALQAAQLLSKYRISFVDAIIWATAEFHGLVLWTLDRRLANKSPNIRYLLEAE
ncbi:unannotated protein [freshwater metagenome]|uniref:Unannotated protein n=1 Tax=freshwater metagenome TaxID=449393 RepID=A0A6J6RT44_9ZZZZ